MLHWLTVADCEHLFCWIRMFELFDFRLVISNHYFIINLHNIIKTYFYVRIFYLIIQHFSYLKCQKKYMERSYFVCLIHFKMGGQTANLTWLYITLYHVFSINLYTFLTGHWTIGFYVFILVFNTIYNENNNKNDMESNYNLFLWSDVEIYLKKVYYFSAACNKNM